MTTVYINVVVYAATKTSARHTALWLRFNDDSPSCLMGAVGPSGALTFVCRPVVDPTALPGFARRVAVGTLETEETPAQIEQFLSEVEITAEPGYSCLTWISEALAVLKTEGKLSDDAFVRGTQAIAREGDEAKKAEGA